MARWFFNLLVLNLHLSITRMNRERLTTFSLTITIILLHTLSIVPSFLQDFSSSNIFYFHFQCTASTEGLKLMKAKYKSPFYIHYFLDSVSSSSNCSSFNCTPSIYFSSNYFPFNCSPSDRSPSDCPPSDCSPSDCSTLDCSLLNCSSPNYCSPNCFSPSCSLSELFSF